MEFVPTHTLDADLSQLLAALGIDSTLAARLARWSPLGQAALINLTRTLSLGTNKFRETAEWADEIARRDGVDPAQVLSDLHLIDIMADLKQSVPLKQKAVRAYLFARRFPELALIRGAIDQVIAAAKLPSDVSVQVPENLERNEIRVQFTARTDIEFRERIAKLQMLNVQAILDTLSKVGPA